jgi:homoserine O-acetyltransferase
MIGNGLSSSPSNTPEPYNASRFPQVTAYDNVRAQHRLVTEKFGIKHIRLVTGWSMGALQTFHWGALYPDMMDLLAPFCGSAKCSRHNFVFLEGVKAALQADAAWDDGWYKSTSPRKACAPWRGSMPAGASRRTSIARARHQDAGLLVAGGFPGRVLGGLLPPKDPNNLLAMLWTWQNGDISANEVYNGDFKAALGAIKAKAYVMPGQTDLYFPVADSEFEVANMPNAELDPGAVDLGPLRRRAGHQSGRRRLPRRQAEGTARILTQCARWCL